MKKSKIQSIRSKFEGDGSGNTILFLVSSINKDGKRVNSSPTITKMVDYCTKNGINHLVIPTNTSRIVKVNKSGTIVVNNGTKDITIDPKSSVGVARRSILNTTNSILFIDELERSGVEVVNSRYTIELCEDKYKTYEELVHNKISTPKSIVVNQSDEDNLLKIIDKEFNGEFPIIGKLSASTHGVGVFKIESRDSLIPYLQTIRKLDPEFKLILQEFIDSSSDYRVHVLNGEVVEVMRRSHAEDDFRNNVHQGADVELVESPDPEIIDLSLNADDAVKGFWTGVDIIQDKKTKKYYVLEVNSSPGTEGLIKASRASKGGKINIIKEVIDKVLGSIVPTKGAEVGPINTINIKGIGDLESLFDTGNSTSSLSLDAEIIKVGRSNIEFSVKTSDEIIKLVKPIHKIIKVKSNSSDVHKYSERYVVLFDIEFNGHKIKSYPVNLNNRSRKRTPVLVNLDLITKLGVVINPNK